MTRRCLLLALLACLIIPTTAQAWIVPLERATPSGSTTYTYKQGVPYSGITSNVTRYPHWFRVTVAYDTTTGDVLVGCRGHGQASVRLWTWTHGAGWGLVRCRNASRWRTVLRGISPKVFVEAYVTFRDKEAG